MADDEQDQQGPASASAGNDWPAPVPLTPGTGSMPGPPPMPSVDRVHAAWQRRVETDYIFDYWTALGWTILTLGIYSFYVFYQLVRRMRDHNQRRVDLFDAALAFAWDEAAGAAYNRS